MDFFMAVMVVMLAGMGIPIFFSLLAIAIEAVAVVWWVLARAYRGASIFAGHLVGLRRARQA